MNYFKKILVTFLSLLIFGCPKETTLGEKIKELESQGILLKLDRSDDLLGTDVDKNGIRDDIDEYINSLPINAEQKLAVKQVAKNIQLIMGADLNKPEELYRARLDGTNSIHCIASKFKTLEDAFMVDSKIRALTTNTRNRTQKYFQYDSALSGTSWRLPRDGENTCTGGEK